LFSARPGAGGARRRWMPAAAHRPVSPDRQVARRLSRARAPSGHPADGPALTCGACLLLVQEIAASGRPDADRVCALRRRLITPGTTWPSRRCPIDCERAPAAKEAA